MKDKHAKCKATSLQQNTALHNILGAFENDMLFKLLGERYRSDISIFEQVIRNEHDSIPELNPEWGYNLFLEEDFGSKELLAKLKKGKKQTEKALKLIEQASELLAERKKMLGDKWR